jgi:hypothetical protein
VLLGRDALVIRHYILLVQENPFAFEQVIQGLASGCSPSPTAQSFLIAQEQGDSNLSSISRSIDKPDRRTMISRTAKDAKNMDAWPPSETSVCWQLHVQQKQKCEKAEPQPAKSIPL